MFAIIGICAVFAAIGLGHLMEHGHFSVLFQPAELVIIGGAAFGAFIISSPKKVLSLTLKSISKVFSSHEKDQKAYIELLLLLNEIFYKVKREGFLAIEYDIDNPDSSEVFKKYPTVNGGHASFAIPVSADRTRPLGHCRAGLACRDRPAPGNAA